MTAKKISLAPSMPASFGLSLIHISCQKYGGFYLGSIGGPAAILAQNNIKSIECVEYPELGMEAVSYTHLDVYKRQAHAKLKERLDRGEDLPQYIKDHPIYYAGPAKTPQGMACGSMGPTTAGRIDVYKRQGMERKGNVLSFPMQGLVVLDSGKWGVLYQGFTERQHVSFTLHTCCCKV